MLWNGFEDLPDYCNSTGVVLILDPPLNDVGRGKQWLCERRSMENQLKKTKTKNKNRTGGDFIQFMMNLKHMIFCML